MGLGGLLRKNGRGAGNGGRLFSGTSKRGGGDDPAGPLDAGDPESGEDTGRLVRVISGNIAQLVDEVIEDADTECANAVAHAVALFRARQATRQSRRSAVIELAGILERRRSLLKEHLLTRDESALFEIANKFDIRHRSEAQKTGVPAATTARSMIPA
jgi:hypothetical protein